MVIFSQVTVLATHGSLNPLSIESTVYRIVVEICNGLAFFSGRGCGYASDAGELLPRHLRGGRAALEKLEGGE